MQRQRYPERQRPREPQEEREMPPFEISVREEIRQKAMEMMEEARRLEEKLKKIEKPSFLTLEEWMEEVIIDPSFFLLEKRFRMLFQILEGTRARRVIIPTDLHYILIALSKKERISWDIEEEDYYPELLELIKQWGPPTKAKRQEALRWVSSADFSSLVSVITGYEVVPASKYLQDERGMEFRYGLGSNPIDIRQTMNTLGKTAGRALYEMLAVSEKTGRVIISGTRVFARLCRKVKIPIIELYTEWKRNFKKQHGFAGKFLIIFAAGAASGTIASVLGTLPPPIPHMASVSVGVIVLDG